MKKKPLEKKRTPKVTKNFQKKEAKVGRAKLPRRCHNLTLVNQVLPQLNT